MVADDLSDGIVVPPSADAACERIREEHWLPSAQSQDEPTARSPGVFRGVCEWWCLLRWLRQHVARLCSMTQDRVSVGTEMAPLYLSDTRVQPYVSLGEDSIRRCLSLDLGTELGSCPAEASHLQWPSDATPSTTSPA